MQNNAASVAEAYYKNMAKKDLNAIAALIDPNIEFSGPLTKLKGKDAMLPAIQGFMQAFDTIAIRFVGGNDDKAFLVFDLQCPEPIGTIPSAAFMTVKNGLITRSELFFDARPFK